MKIQLQKSDFLIMCQEQLSSVFDGAIVQGIEFINTDNQKVKISRVEIDFYKQDKDK
ncbi:hypothetical protein [Neobacillus drentensis]|uniref:hypothetical protein n=1 Tax=Neobacillus drentensis TaxID=220684 RepID=UPI002FFDE54A